VFGHSAAVDGIEHPQDFNGPLEAPGCPTDLRTAPTNNDDIGTPEDMDWTPNPPMSSKSGDVRSKAVVPRMQTALNPTPNAADAVAGASRVPIRTQGKDWRRRPDNLSSVDLVRGLI
jgi:hypothetical protein